MLNITSETAFRQNVWELVFGIYYILDSDFGVQVDSIK